VSQTFSSLRGQTLWQVLSLLTLPEAVAPEMESSRLFVQSWRSLGTRRLIAEGRCVGIRQFFLYIGGVKREETTNLR
jgi:hypothetical protein